MRALPIAALAVAVTLATGTAASAGPPTQHDFHDEFTFTEENFCDAGIAVEIAGSSDGRGFEWSRGPDGLVYAAVHATAETTFTSIATGVSIRSVERVLFKDLRVIDNGDGTLTVVVFGTGNATLFGPDGTAIVRDPGQFRFELLLDHGGTPDDPSDDVELDFRVLKESTGRTDDFCGPAVAALLD